MQVDGATFKYLICAIKGSCKLQAGDQPSQPPIGTPQLPRILEGFVRPTEYLDGGPIGRMGK